ncbi:hypothetical protein ID850_09910 [Xenorhabdus sp. Flor]|uniref:hypothetical protein n=1 Tax=Xenorhabdus cabanillasii TaxID=351673 RepID=UPI0019CE308B|nr:hypothetical protein [Xenorhabdus sp. Flor]MBD2815073.1 hypothetical protein [Xenorhabdus sp. Flor]
MTIYPDLQENVYIVQSFVTAFLRKASKLALEWLDTEINRSTSPISGLRFITDYVAESVHDYHPATLHNIHSYHHPSHLVQLILMPGIITIRLLSLKIGLLKIKISWKKICK